MGGQRRPAVIAHRGASDQAPENTLPAFQRAIEVGSDGIETDVQMTKDGHLVLIHDARVDRTTDGEGEVRDFTREELRRLDAGLWFGAEFKGTPIPLLGELLDLCGGRVPLALELKSEGLQEALKDEIARRDGVAPTITFTSFSLEDLLALKRLWPEASCGYLTRDSSRELAYELKAEGIMQICPRAGTFTADDVAVWHRVGLSVRAWGVKTEELVTQCAALGVDGFTVDFPERALQLLGQTNSVGAP